ncbi:glutathione S-transferase family protein [Aquirhabdus parva]|uniref:Glutathione S-transferase family protein n=1 Tax=Aquirhabdus parva TaxID=2283318 RepID=A0A345P2V1_9GAMM|nr:glutathione S-transferase family protein [Aquirhabdus parva]AXI01610.1 glutathione S-transferase family protein [Aquirhabdus parva]
MYQLYIANKNYSSWSLRPWALMTELGIPFEERNELFTDDNWEIFRKFSPSGKVPCLVVDNDFAVWDSLAIVEYLAEHYPKVWPTGAKARAWARSASAEMHSGFSPLRDICSMNCSVRIQLKDIPAPLAKDIARIDELWNEGLSRFGGPFLAGNEFTAVDAFFTPVAFRISTYGLELSPAAMAYSRRLLELPSLKVWADAAILEPRHEEHEEWCLQNGSIISDVRLTKA